MILTPAFAILIGRTRSKAVVSTPQQDRVFIISLEAAGVLLVKYRLELINFAASGGQF
jgi:hypothetical protein